VALWYLWRCGLNGNCLGASNCCGVCHVTFMEFTWELPIKLWSSLQACTGSVTTLKGLLVDQVFSFWWEGLRRIRCAIVAFGVHCGSTPLKRRVASARLWTSGYIASSLCASVTRQPDLMHFSLW
jgi:hypothetical protein